jgi:hypothetical protein
MDSCKIKIECPTHGFFMQFPRNHLKYGCPKRGCGGNYPLVNDVEDVMKRLFEVHGNRYTYILPEKFNAKTKIKVNCIKHGDFYQSLRNILVLKRGCALCSISKGEEAIMNYLDKHNIKYVYNESYGDCRNVGKLRFDFRLPNHNNMIIEFDGVQHFKPIERFGGDEYFQYNLLKLLEYRI